MQMHTSNRAVEILIDRVDPVATYYPTDIDESGDPKYYGFMTKDGFWYIVKFTNPGAIRYCAYSDNNTVYTTAWTNRATLVYQYPNQVGIK